MGSLIAGFLADKFGRNLVLLANDFVFIVGTCILWRIYAHP